MAELEQVRLFRTSVRSVPAPQAADRIFGVAYEGAQTIDCLEHPSPLVNLLGGVLSPAMSFPLLEDS